MSDLVEDLRQYAQYDKHSVYQSQTLEKAADEIERLQAIVTAQKKLILEYEILTDRSAYADEDYDEDDDFYSLAMAERAVEAAEKAR